MTEKSSPDSTRVDKGHEEDFEFKEVSRSETDEPVFDEARTARLLRKIDINVIPFVALLYLWGLLLISFSLSYFSFHC
jgi:hypothetical protein